ncbi:hypothetical protein Gogos_012987, partial [Gossypium gossypioides]|nr:hypothetical protein [Gossypium gossypioides]
MVGLWELKGCLKKLFLWLPIRGIILNDPSSGLILFDIGVANKQLSISLVEDRPV